MKRKVALVTGASRGIGAATARLLAAKGYAVGVNWHQAEEAARRVVEEIISKGGTAIPLSANVGIESDVLEMFQRLDHELGPVSALVNNAGICPPLQAIEELTATQLLDVFSTNVFGAFYCSREAVKRMSEGGGAIVNVSSEAGRFGGNRLVDYAASKSALNALTIGLAREVAHRAIRVNAVSPGIIATEMHGDISGEKWQTLEKSLPMGRSGSPDEVAETILWLLSDEASYISGAVLPVSGGR